MKDMIAAVYGFVLWTFAISMFYAVLSFGYAQWQVAAIQNRVMMLVQQRGGVDATIQDIVRTELSGHNITVTRVTGSNPGTPYGDPVTLTIGAAYHVLGVDQPVGQVLLGTSIYRERK